MPLATVRQVDTQRRRRVAGLVTAAATVLVVGLAIVSGNGAPATAANGGAVVGARFSSRLLAGIPQRGALLGQAGAPVRVEEFADLQCPYCDQFARDALPALINRYVRSGQVSFEFRNLSFIGPGSVAAARVAAGAQEQNKLWNFVDLMYLNQGTENSGYVTRRYLRRLLTAVPGLAVAGAERASRSAQTAAVLRAATAAARRGGIAATPSFLIGRTGGPLQLFQPDGLTAGAFSGELDRLLGHR